MFFEFNKKKLRPLYLSIDFQRFLVSIYEEALVRVHWNHLICVSSVGKERNRGIGTQH